MGSDQEGIQSSNYSFLPVVDPAGGSEAMMGTSEPDANGEHSTWPLYSDFSESSEGEDEFENKIDNESGMGLIISDQEEVQPCNHSFLPVVDPVGGCEAMMGTSEPDANGEHSTWPLYSDISESSEREEEFENKKHTKKSTDKMEDFLSSDQEGVQPCNDIHEAEENRGTQSMDGGENKVKGDLTVTGSGRSEMNFTQTDDDGLNSTSRKDVGSNEKKEDNFARDPVEGDIDETEISEGSKGSCKEGSKLKGHTDQGMDDCSVESDSIICLISDSEDTEERITPEKQKDTLEHDVKVEADSDSDLPDYFSNVTSDRISEEKGDADIDFWSSSQRDCVLAGEVYQDNGEQMYDEIEGDMIRASNKRRKSDTNRNKKTHHKKCSEEAMQQVGQRRKNEGYQEEQAQSPELETENNFESQEDDDIRTVDDILAIPFSQPDSQMVVEPYMANECPWGLEESTDPLEYGSPQYQGNPESPTTRIEYPPAVACVRSGHTTLGRPQSPVDSGRPQRPLVPFPAVRRCKPSSPVDGSQDQSEAHTTRTLLYKALHHQPKLVIKKLTEEQIKEWAPVRPVYQRPRRNLRRQVPRRVKRPVTRTCNDRARFRQRTVRSSVNKSKDYVSESEEDTDFEPYSTSDSESRSESECRSRVKRVKEWAPVRPVYQRPRRNLRRKMPLRVNPKRVLRDQESLAKKQRVLGCQEKMRQSRARVSECSSDSETERTTHRGKRSRVRGAQRWKRIKAVASSSDTENTSPAKNPMTVLEDQESPAKNPRRVLGCQETGTSKVGVNSLFIQEKLKVEPMDCSSDDADLLLCVTLIQKAVVSDTDSDETYIEEESLDKASVRDGSAEQFLPCRDVQVKVEVEDSKTDINNAAAHSGGRKVSSFIGGIKVEGEVENSRYGSFGTTFGEAETQTNISMCHLRNEKVPRVCRTPLSPYSDSSLAHSGNMERTAQIDQSLDIAQKERTHCKHISLEDGALDKRGRNDENLETSPKEGLGSALFYGRRSTGNQENEETDFEGMDAMETQSFSPQILSDTEDEAPDNGFQEPQPFTPELQSDDQSGDNILPEARWSPLGRSEDQNEEVGTGNSSQATSCTTQSSQSGMSVEDIFATRTEESQTLSVNRDEDIGDSLKGEGNINQGCQEHDDEEGEMHRCSDDTSQYFPSDSQLSIDLDAESESEERESRTNATLEKSHGSSLQENCQKPSKHLDREQQDQQRRLLPCQVNGWSQAELDPVQRYLLLHEQEPDRYLDSDPLHQEHQTTIHTPSSIIDSHGTDTLDSDQLHEKCNISENGSADVRGTGNNRFREGLQTEINPTEKSKGRPLGVPRNIGSRRPSRGANLLQTMKESDQRKALPVKRTIQPLKKADLASNFLKAADRANLPDKVAKRAKASTGDDKKKRKRGMVSDLSKKLIENGGASSGRNDHKKRKLDKVPKIPNEARNTDAATDTANLPEEAAQTENAGLAEPQLDEESVIACILSWSTEWISDQHATVTAPQLLAALPAVESLKPNRASFADIRSYQETFTAFLLLEIWHKISSAAVTDVQCIWKQSSMVVKKSCTNEVQYEGEGSIPDESINVGDLVLVDMTMISNAERQYQFGLIQQLTRKEGTVTLALHNFHIVPSRTRITVLTSLCHYLAQVRALMALPRSPLTKHLIQPDCRSIYAGEGLAKRLGNKTRVSEADLMTAYEDALLRPDRAASQQDVIGLLDGPPGCGKTEFLANLIKAIREVKNSTSKVTRDKNLHKLLVCAPTSRALDVLMRGIWRKITKRGNRTVRGVELIRVDRADGREPTDPRLTDFLLSSVLARTSEQGDQYTNLSEDEVKIKILQRADVVGCTLKECGSELIRSSLVGNVFAIFVDDACHCLETEVLLPLQCRARKLILAGDQTQGIVNIHSKLLKDQGFEWSILDRISKNFEVEDARIHRWEIQRRMEEEIAMFPSAYFYWHKLKTEKLKVDPFPLQSYIVFDVSDSKETAEAGSTVNIPEADFILELVRQIQLAIVGKNISLGVMVPCQGQKEHLKQRLARCGPAKCIVGTLDDFYGWQKDIIILSCTRTSKADGDCGFVTQPRQLNLALTRAQLSLVIVGNIRELRKMNNCWEALVDDASHRRVVFSTSRSSYEREARICLQQSASLPPNTSVSTPKMYNTTQGQEPDTAMPTALGAVPNGLSASSAPTCSALPPKQHAFIGHSASQRRRETERTLIHGADDIIGPHFARSISAPTAESVALSRISGSPCLPKISPGSVRQSGGNGPGETVMEGQSLVGRYPPVQESASGGLPSGAGLPGTHAAGHDSSLIQGVLKETAHHVSDPRLQNRWNPMQKQLQEDIGERGCGSLPRPGLVGRERHKSASAAEVSGRAPKRVRFADDSNRSDSRTVSTTGGRSLLHSSLAGKQPSRLRTPLPTMPNAYNGAGQQRPTIQISPAKVGFNRSGSRSKDPFDIAASRRSLEEEGSMFGSRRGSILETHSGSQIDSIAKGMADTQRPSHPSSKWKANLGLENHKKRGESREGGRGRKSTSLNEIWSQIGPADPWAKNLCERDGL